MEPFFRPVVAKVVKEAPTSFTKIFDNDSYYSLYVGATLFEKGAQKALILVPPGYELEKTETLLTSIVPVPNYNYVTHSADTYRGKPCVAVKVAFPVTKEQTSYHTLYFVNDSPLVYNVLTEGDWSVAGLALGALYIEGETHVEFKVYRYSIKTKKVDILYAGPRLPPREVFIPIEKGDGVALCIKLNNFEMTGAFAVTKLPLIIRVWQFSLPLIFFRPTMATITVAQKVTKGEVTCSAFSAGDVPELAKLVVEEAHGVGKLAEIKKKVKEVLSKRPVKIGIPTLATALLIMYALKHLKQM